MRTDCGFRLPRDDEAQNLKPGLLSYEEQTNFISENMMSPNDGQTSCAPDRLLSTLAEWLHANNDRELSRVLQISPRVLRGIRSGRISVSPSLLLLIAESTGKKLDELRDTLAERRRKARIASRMSAAADSDVPFSEGQA